MPPRRGFPRHGFGVPGSTHPPNRRTVLTGSCGLALVNAFALAAKAQPVDLGTGQRFLQTNLGLIWSKANADALDEALANASRHGLDPAVFQQLLSSASPTNTDQARTQTALAYGRVLAQGLVDPRKVFAIYTVPIPQFDLADSLADALARSELKSWLDNLAPRTLEYAALSSAFLAMQARANFEPAPQLIPAGPSIVSGDADARLEVVDERLGQAGFPTRPEDELDPSIFGPGLVTRVRSFQRSRGLKEDGIVGPHTRAELNEGPAEHAVQLAIALERRRWLDRSPPSERIDVNIAACTLAYVRDDEIWRTAITVCGRAGHETPELQASFSRLVVNPPWRAPSSIARAEIIPRGPAYLSKHHMRNIGGRIVQSPGPWAALGAIKFDMHDPYAIYLHDTPSKSLFARSQRHLSHGCVRIQDAVAFGQMLAASAGQGDQFASRISSGRTGTVGLSRSIPVRLIYHTAFIGDDAQPVFRADVYGWDDKLAQEMGLTGVPTDRGEAPEVEPLGP